MIAVFFLLAQVTFLAILNFESKFVSKLIYFSVFVAFFFFFFSLPCFFPQKLFTKSAQLQENKSKKNNKRSQVTKRNSELLEDGSKSKF